MLTLRDLRRRIKSASNLVQITRAMEMVATVRGRNAQARALPGHPQAEAARRMLAGLGRDPSPGVEAGGRLPLLAVRPIGRRCVVLVGTDRGLCGSLNANLFREALRRDRPENVYVTVGKKARSHLARHLPGGEGRCLAEFSLPEGFPASESRELSLFLIRAYERGEIDAVEILANRFEGPMRWGPHLQPLLPLLPATGGEPARRGEAPVPLCEPEAGLLLARLVPFLIHTLVHQALLDARAAEWSARRIAMKRATEAADKLIATYRLRYNKARQDAVTGELMEIASARLSS